MKIVLSINLGGRHTTTNVRESHAHAAGRWGAQYVELTVPTWSQRTDPFGIKLDIHRFPFPPGCRVAMLDGDCIVRADCPSLFDRVPRECMGAVANNQGGAYEAVVDANAGLWWESVAAMMNCAAGYDPATYFNGGVLVFSPERHLDAWRLADAAVRVALGERGAMRTTATGGAVSPMLEQTAMNVACVALGVPVHLLPPAFNRLGPAAWGCGGAMPDYVLHLANLGSLRGDKGAVLAGIDWRTVPEAAEARVPA